MNALGMVPDAPASGVRVVERLPYRAPTLRRLRRDDDATYGAYAGATPFVRLRPGEGSKPCGAASISEHVTYCLCPGKACIDAHDVAEEAAHKRAADRYAKDRPMADAEVEGVRASYGAWARVERGGRSRAYTDETSEPERAVRTFEADDLKLAETTIRSRPVRAGRDRNELLSAAWLELVEPTTRVAEAEVGLDVVLMANKAVERAQAKLRFGR